MNINKHKMRILINRITVMVLEQCLKKKLVIKKSISFRINWILINNKKIKLNNIFNNKNIVELTTI